MSNRQRRRVIIAKATSPAYSYGLEPLEGRFLMAVIDLAVSTPLPLVSSDTTPAITGTVSDIAASVNVTVTHNGDGDVGTFPAQTDGQGGWSFVAPDENTLAEGHYDLLITASANGGADLGSLNLSNQLVIDATVPSVAIDAGQLPATVNDDKTLTGTFADANISSVVVNLQGDGSFTAVLDTNAMTWSALIVIAGLEDGSFPVSVRATDQAGNQTTIDAAGPLTVDREAEVTVNDNLSNSALATVTGTIGADVTDLEVQVSGVTYSLADEDIVRDGTNWSLTLPALDDGDYVVRASAADAVGNADIVTGRLLIDTVAPTVAIGAEQLPATVAGDITLTGTFDDANIASIVVTLDDGNGGTSTFPAAKDADAKTWSALISAGDGTYSVTVTATDEAGNLTTVSGQGSLTVDRTSPTVALNSGQLPKLTNADITLHGTYADGNIASVVVAVYNTGNSFYFVATLDTEAHTWSAPISIAGVPDGVYSVLVTATDSAGNFGSTGVVNELTIDTTSPSVTSINRANSSPTNAPNVSWTVIFSEDVTSVGTDDFTLVSSGDVTGASITNVSGGGAIWNVSATSGSGDGTLGLNLVDNDSIKDIAGNPLGGSGAGNGDFTGQVYAIDKTAPVVSVNAQVSSNSRPPLSGTVNDPTATITVTVRGATYTATNNGDGTWTLPADTVTTVPDGTHTISVTATDPQGNQSSDTTNFLVVDTTAPVVTITPLTTTTTSPALTGTIDDATAGVVVRINGTNHAAVNQGDGTWSLSAGTIAALAGGVHDVTVTATDTLGNVGTDTSTNELVIVSTQTSVVGNTIRTVHYVDSDGTAVTVLAGLGEIALTFTGVSVASADSGSSRTITSTGGVRQLDIEIREASSTLVFRTNLGGDARTSINNITGDSTLLGLGGPNVNLTGGIDMTGVIQRMRLRRIDTDVTMGTSAGGVVIVADVINNSTIETPNIRAVWARSAFSNSNVNASTIGAMVLTNVEFDNDGMPFGIHALTIRSLKLRQGGTTLVWQRDFTGGIGDFEVTT